MDFYGVNILKISKTFLSSLDLLVPAWTDDDSYSLIISVNDGVQVSKSYFFGELAGNHFRKQSFRYIQ